jgi:integrase
MAETITIPDPVTIANPGIRKGGRTGPVTLTDRMCEKRVDRRTKFYDRKCPGLYVSINVDGVATFSFRYTDRFTGKRKSVWLGVYIAGHFTVDDARAQSHALKGRIGMGENVVETLRQQRTLKAKQGMTVDELLEKRIAFISQLERKNDGELRPRIETWENVESHLKRLVSPRLGKRLATEITSDDIAELSDDIVDGKFGVASVANSRHMRRAVSAMYRWAAQAGRKYVLASCAPWRNLPPLRKEKPRERVLSPKEIRIFWHGLDREDLPWNLRTRLALKLALTTMLRSWELLGAHRDELSGLDGKHARIDVPLRRVKKRRAIHQPLSGHAVEIVRETLAGSNKQFVFASPLGDAPMNRKMMATALRGTTNRDGSVRTPGICQLLGLKPFTPHDLRRTASSIAGDLGFSDAWIAKCLDNQIVKDEHGARVPSVTGRVYNLSQQMRQKRAVLEGIAAGLRRIIAGLPLVEDEEPEPPAAA